MYYFVDKCLPFGSSISCGLFQEFSDAFAYLVEYMTRKPTINYLDDFFFTALLKIWCDWQVQKFLHLCEQINFPVSMDKMFWGTEELVFLGLLLDSKNQLVCIPVDKIVRALELIDNIVVKKKVTVKQIQKLCGFLNFLYRCIVPGRAFSRRLYSYISSSMKPYHHIRVRGEIKSDLKVWIIFPRNPKVFCRPFMDFTTTWTALDINMYSDASKYLKSRGLGAICGNDWMMSALNYEFLALKKPSIEYLEIFAVAAVVVTWIHCFQNKRILLYCDNMSVVHMLNGSSSKCKNYMVLIRKITLVCLIHNVRVYARHICTHKNCLADALSRLKIQKFWQLAPGTMNKILMRCGPWKISG